MMTVPRLVVIALAVAAVGAAFSLLDASSSFTNIITSKFLLTGLFFIASLIICQGQLADYSPLALGFGVVLLFPATDATLLDRVPSSWLDGLPWLIMLALLARVALRTRAIAAISTSVLIVAIALLLLSLDMPAAVLFALMALFVLVGLRSIAQNHRDRAKPNEPRPDTNDANEPLPGAPTAAGVGVATPAGIEPLPQSMAAKLATRVGQLSALLAKRKRGLTMTVRVANAIVVYVGVVIVLWWANQYAARIVLAWSFALAVSALAFYLSWILSYQRWAEFARWKQ